MFKCFNIIKCIIVSVIIFVVVKTDLCYGYSHAELHSIKRQAFQEQPWIWGNRDLSNTNSNIQAETTTTEPDASNPCSPFEPKKLNFSKRWRISEAKCFEYIWELKNRDDVNKRAQACHEYQLQDLDKRGIGRPHFAIGGRNTLPGEFPHMGAIGWRAAVGTWLFKCGSSLISPKFLLTAAHCSQVSSADSTVANTKPEIVRLGDKNIIDHFANGQEPLDVKILQFIVHPDYSPPKKHTDIALIELVDKVNFNKFVQPACLWAKPDTSPLGTKASLTGWGYVDSARQKSSPELQAAHVDIIDSKLCNDLLKPYFQRHFNGVVSSQLCAGVLAGGVDSCQGDSGGPLQVRIPLPIITEGSMSYVIGVTSFGFGCARPNTPGVYTRVSSFIDWIESIVWT